MNVLSTPVERFEQMLMSDPGHRAYDNALKTWVGSGLRLERLNESALHHFRDAVREGQIAGLDVRLPDRLNTFVIQHDWAAAFKGATDFSEGEFKAPYDECAFEFRVSGKRVIAYYGEYDLDDNRPKILVPNIELFDDRWVAPPVLYSNYGDGWITEGSTRHDPLEQLKVLMAEQIRAICISLEAGAATTDLVRAPERLNKLRDKRGRAKLSDYFVVRLNHRERHASPRGGNEPHGSKRLHFRRGHWRHYEDHNTWIKWTLVGNPDLGFVDKEYRL